MIDEGKRDGPAVHVPRQETQAEKFVVENTRALT